jgi:glycosyltransferase involved in cell wall biosynthesis
MLQDYPKEKMEVIVVDGGSSDKTCDIAKRFGVEKLLDNPYRGQEIGKAIGVDNAEGDLIAFIDSDNVLPEKKWLRKMVKPFLEEKNLTGSEPIMFTYKRDAPPMVRYCSLVGCDDPLCHILGNRDKWSWVKMGWTDLPVKTVDRGDYILVNFNSNQRVPTMGANGFIVRKRHLKSVRYSPYIDIDVFYNLVRYGYVTYAKVKTGIIHLHADTITQYLKKKIRRVQIHYMSQKYRTYPWSISKEDATKIILKIMVIPVVWETIQGYKNVPDKAWLLHLIIPIITILTYTSLHILYIFDR